MNVFERLILLNKQYHENFVPQFKRTNKSYYSCYNYIIESYYKKLHTHTIRP